MRVTQASRIAPPPLDAATAGQRPDPPSLLTTQCLCFPQSQPLQSTLVCNKTFEKFSGIYNGDGFIVFGKVANVAIKFKTSRARAA